MVFFIDSNELEKKYLDTIQVFAERFRYLIDEAGYKQAEVAELLDITPPQISRMVNGTSNPKFKTLVKIAILFNCSFDFLLSRDHFPSEKRYITAIEEMNSSVNILKDRKREGDIEISDEIAEIALDLIKRAVVDILKEKDNDK